MKRLILGTIVAAAFALPAMAADPTPAAPTDAALDHLCSNTKLSAADQADCRLQMGAATDEAQRDEVRRSFEMRSQGSTATGTSAAPAEIMPDSPQVPDGKAGGTVSRTSPPRTKDAP